MIQNISMLFVGDNRKFNVAEIHYCEGQATFNMYVRAKYYEMENIILF